MTYAGDVTTSSRPKGLTHADSTFNATGLLLSGTTLRPLSTLATRPYTRAIWKMLKELGRDFGLIRRPSRGPPAIVCASLRVPVRLDGIDPFAEYVRPAVGCV